MRDFENKLIKGTILVFLVTAVGMIMAFKIMSFVDDTERCIEPIKDNSATIEMMNVVKMNIADEIDNYISKVAPDSEINSGLLFELCDKYEIDIIFVLAQGQVESHFATKGTAKKTKSIFNVGAYDGHSASKQKRNGFGYNNANDSIEPYLILLSNKYLVNGKTETDLMMNYVNYLGQRYASNPRYEKMLRGVYNRISENTNLNNLVDKYNHYKMQLI